MRVLYIDIDTLRADHLGCYGYHRNTSPNVDALAERAVRFENCYNTDAPCLPSRTALWSGRFGFHTGVVNHGGTAADPFIEGPTRGFRDQFDATSWMSALRRAGFRTVTVSPFGERHGAWHWYAGYNEVYNPGRGGMEIADDVTPIALDWIRRNAGDDNWFLHVNYWDPHTPYRTPQEFGDLFRDDPLPEWLTEEVRQRGWDGFGPRSPQEPHGWGTETFYQRYPRMPARLDSMEAVKQWIDGYDVGIRYADEHAGRLLNALADDPHEQHDLAAERPDLVDRAMGLLAEWYHEMAATGQYDIDPMMTVLREGGPFHTRGRLPGYLARLQETGRAHHAELLAARHPDEA